MKLGADQADVSVRDPSQFLIVCKSLLAVKAVSKAGGQHRNISQDDHGASSRRNLFYPLKIFLLCEPHGRWRKDNTVFQSYMPQFNGAEQRFKHNIRLPLLGKFMSRTLLYDPPAKNSGRKSSACL